MSFNKSLLKLRCQTFTLFAAEMIPTGWFSETALLSMNNQIEPKYTHYCLTNVLSLAGCAVREGKVFFWKKECKVFPTMPHCCNYSSAWWWAKTIRRQLVVLRRGAVQLTLLFSVISAWAICIPALSFKINSLIRIWCLNQYVWNGQNSKIFDRETKMLLFFCGQWSSSLSFRCLNI